MGKQGLLMAIPGFIFGAILIYLLVLNVYFSFLNWSLFNLHPSFAGISTYQSLVSQYFFKLALTHTVVYVLSAVIIGDVLGILVAGILYFIKSNIRRAIYLSIFLYPLAVPSSSYAITWQWLFNPQTGINLVLRVFHFPNIIWLTTEPTVYAGMIIIETWAYTGLAVLFFLASYMSVDRSIIEAAKIDGANNLYILFRVILPNSMNGMIVSTALLFLFSFRIFTVPFTIGGPTNPNMMSLVEYIYILFSTEYFSLSSALSVLVAIIAAIVIIPYAILGLKRWVFRR
ncbi:sugar ABC transporter permease [Sulfolobus sp. A20]|nr:MULTISPECIES: glucose ABC transporter permease GlcT [unclassified Sulfolobus]TRM80481.1 sugar ABC transporter permease [Sulfolobus sp. D5]TRM86364.1 sugar ABC transporter permease [Sulfolobus sp. C3]TRN00964.1 sugar ABC transporter permease [Sulfolobus sp. E1]AOL16558.1 sugar ABC transporter permease [Sulfolobus sp. A20]TRM96992.1 sugar ABC transporter permease [Sulfolobus sp. B1]